MAQSVVINGVTYPDVPAVDIPKSGGGTDDGSDVPLCLYHTPWGAWSGGADGFSGASHA